LPLPAPSRLDSIRSVESLDAAVDRIRSVSPVTDMTVDPGYR
jgi:hypothetical protein